MTDTREINCVFCEKNMEKEVFRLDYDLLAWRDDPADPYSLNKLAKPAHPKCLRTFVELNWEQIKKVL